MSQEFQHSESSSNTELGTVDLLQQLKSGMLNAKQLKPAVRQQVVAALMDDGYSTSDMAKILMTSDRTIERDRKVLRESTVLNKHPDLLPQMAGRIQQEAELCMQRIRRATRGKEVSAAVKVEGERCCYQMVSDLLQRLQSLGYLPTAKQQVEAELVHHTGGIAEFKDILSESTRLLELASDGEGDPTRLRLLQEITKEATRGKMQAELEALEGHLEAEQSVEADYGEGGQHE